MSSEPGGTYGDTGENLRPFLQLEKNLFKIIRISFQLVYDYFILGPIPELKPKLADTVTDTKI